MVNFRQKTVATFLGLYCIIPAHAQQPQPDTAVPRLVRVSNIFRPADGQTPAPVESVTLSIYRDEQGGAPLWQETQNVGVDSEGRYNLLMGSTLNEGMPVNLFGSSEPRWLGARFNRTGETEQSRTRLASVPYALKASDSETLGGKPASAYLLAVPTVGTDSASVSGVAASTGTGATTPVKPKALPQNNGLPNYISMFTNTTDLIDSAMYQGPTTYFPATTGIGINVNGNPFITLDGRSNPAYAKWTQMGMAQNTDYLSFFASDQYGPAIFWDPAKDMRFGKGGAGLYNASGFVEQMRIQSSTGYVGIGTKAPGAQLDVAGNINSSGSITAVGTIRAEDILAAGTINLNGPSSTVNYLGMPLVQTPYQNPSNVALGVGAYSGSDSTGMANTAVGNGALHGHQLSGQGKVFPTGWTNLPGPAGTFIPVPPDQPGSYNTAYGYEALYDLTEGWYNTAFGSLALGSTTTGWDNTATGYQALFNNTTGTYNTATGLWALLYNTIGYSNMATGMDALWANTDGDYNTASGAAALWNNIHGSNNTVDGYDAMGSNTTGSNNIAIGYLAGYYVANSNNIEIGTVGASTDSSVIRIGGNVALGDSASQVAFYASGIAGSNISGVPVLVDTSTGQLGVSSSSRRFKEDIEDMGNASDGLMHLRPVTFRYKQPFADGSKPVQYGLIAEEVAEVYPDLVARSADGQIETVKYQVLDSMLLNQVQKQQTEIKTLQQQNQSLQERLAKVEALLATTATANQR